MPMYEYECRKCKEKFEVLQKVGGQRRTVLSKMQCR